MLNSISTVEQSVASKVDSSSSVDKQKDSKGVKNKTIFFFTLFQFVINDILCEQQIKEH